MAVALPPAMRTAGMPANGKRMTRRGGNVPRALTFNLLSGEPLPEGEMDAAAYSASAAENLVWENGCAYLSSSASSALPPPPPLSAPSAPPPAAVPAAYDVMPFARDDDASRRANEAIAPIERELTQLNLVKDRLEREYHRMPLSKGRTAEERRNKEEMEEKLKELNTRIFELKTRLRSLVTMRR